MPTNANQSCRKIFTSHFFFCDKVITCGDTQHLLYEATDLAFFFTYKRQITGDEYTFGNQAHNSCHAYFDNFVKKHCSNQSTFAFYFRSVSVNAGAQSGFTLCWLVNSPVISTLFYLTTAIVVVVLLAAAL